MPRVGAAPIVRIFRVPVLVSPSLPYEDFSVRTDDGLTLRGWLFRPSKPPRGLLVYLHGINSNRVTGAEVAARFVPKGWAVLAYDQRAHGASDGTFCTYGAHEVSDLRRAIDAVGITPVIVAGESMGGAVALQAAVVEPRIVAVIAAATFSDLRTIVGEAAGPLDHDGVIAAVEQDVEAEAGFRISEISPRRAAASLRVPALIIQGTDDLFCAPEHSRRIFEALQGDRELVTVKGAGHPDILKRPEVWDLVERWIAALPTRPGPFGPTAIR